MKTLKIVSMINLIAISVFLVLVIMGIVIDGEVGAYLFFGTLIYVYFLWYSATVYIKAKELEKK